MESIWSIDLVARSVQSACAVAGRKAFHYIRSAIDCIWLAHCPANLAASTTPPPPTAVLDTNVVLAWWVFADPRILKLTQALETGRLRWCLTEPMRAELAAVLRRPLQARWEAARERALTFETSSCAEVVGEPSAGTGAPWICADRDDQKFLDLAWAARAPWLLTRDRALLHWARGARAVGLHIMRPEAWSEAEAPSP